jgi:hypothetical protein
LLPLTILAPVAHDTTAMVCRMTGAVSWAPCESAVAQEAPAPEQDALADASCCDFITIAHPRAPIETAPDVPRPTFSGHALGSLRATGPLPTLRTSLNAPAISGLGPPIRQRTQTFLI